MVKVEKERKKSRRRLRRVDLVCRLFDESEGKVRLTMGDCSSNQEAVFEFRIRNSRKLAFLAQA